LGLLGDGGDVGDDGGDVGDVGGDGGDVGEASSGKGELCVGVVGFAGDASGLGEAMAKLSPSRPKVVQ